MSELIEVTPSGTVGKQVFATTKKVVLLSVLLTGPSGLSRKIVIRDGNASGEVKLTMSTYSVSLANIDKKLRHTRFDKGMHVKVLGTNALAYLEIN